MQTTAFSVNMGRRMHRDHGEKKPAPTGMQQPAHEACEHPARGTRDVRSGAVLPQKSCREALLRCRTLGLEMLMKSVVCGWILT